MSVLVAGLPIRSMSASDLVFDAVSLSGFPGRRDR
jgi:hypothetical protein